MKDAGSHPDLPDFQTCVPDLSRPVPLFPLPNVVLFPMGLLPLHIFEPRYRRMMQDCLENPFRQRVIAMALLRGDYRAKYYTNHADIHPTTCVGRVLRYEELADGRFNLILQGLARVRVVSEDRTGEYRLARLTGLNSGSVTSDPAGALRARLRSLVCTGALSHLSAAQQIAEAFDAGLSTGQIVDLIAYYLLGQRIEIKQRLLEELDETARGTALLAHLKDAGVPCAAWRASAVPVWPPRVNDN